VHGQFVTVVVVLPATVAVKVATCPAITTSALGLTVTVITFATPLLHAATSKAAHANVNIITAQLLNLRHSITDFSPITVRRGSPAHAVTESRLVNLIILSSSSGVPHILPRSHSKRVPVRGILYFASLDVPPSRNKLHLRLTAKTSGLP